MTRIHLATALARRDDGCVLLVASRYANHAEPLWTLPGGRQLAGELLVETVARELLEETGLRCTVGKLAYVSESYDGAVHVLNATFCVDLASYALEPAHARDHVTGAAWICAQELHERIVAAVVRDPLLAYLEGALPQGYAGFHEAGITIQWPPDSA